LEKNRNMSGQSVAARAPARRCGWAGVERC
jgi:hypothetical protein